MVSKIRLNTFETNSSSYHTLTIRKISEEQPRKEIIKGEDLIIDTYINYKTIGYISSYQFIGKSTYEKAQLALRFMGYELDEQLDNLIEDSEWKDGEQYNFNKREELQKERFYKAPLIQGFVQAIKQYIGEDKEVNIEFTTGSSPFIDVVSDEGESFKSLFDVNDITNVDKIKEAIYKVIFNNNIEMIEECESNE